MADLLETPNKDLMAQILDELEKMNSTNDKHKICFSGEGDSNQTEFEQLSNHLEIAVIARNKKVAYACLHLLRMIVDDREDLLDSIKEELKSGDYGYPKEGETVTIQHFIKRLGDSEKTYFHSFDLDETFKTTLSGRNPNWQQGMKDEDLIQKEHITKTLSDVDVWTFSRIKNDIYELFEIGEDYEEEEEKGKQE